MNSSNALGFATVGLAMKYIPLWFPSLLGANAAPESVRGLWLVVMSFVLMGVSMIYFSSRAWASRSVWAGWAIRPIAGALAARRQAASVPSRGGVRV